MGIQAGIEDTKVWDPCFVEDERRLASSLSTTVRQRSLSSLLLGNFAMRIVKIFAFG